MTHLGGASLDQPDWNTFLPDVWIDLIQRYNVKSVLDVGCGAGWSTEWFKNAGMNVLGIEGWDAAIARSRVPSLVEKHDFTTGPIYIDCAFDLCWCAEFVEHVDAQYIDNFLLAFTYCKYVCMTFATPGQGGYHHVNEQPEEYWVAAFEKHGFVLDREQTDRMRATSKGEPWGRRTLTMFVSTTIVTPPPSTP